MNDLATVCLIWAVPFIIWGAFIVVVKARQVRAREEDKQLCFDEWLARRNKEK